MFGKDTLRALMDGKVLTLPDFSLRIRMDENGIVHKISFPDKNGGWTETTVDLNKFMRQEMILAETYDLTFQEALLALASGKVVACESDPRIRIQLKEGIVIQTCIGKTTVVKGLSISESDMTAGWRIADEQIKVPKQIEEKTDDEGQIEAGGDSVEISEDQTFEGQNEVKDYRCESRKEQVIRLKKDENALVKILSDSAYPINMREIVNKYLTYTDHRGITGVEKSKIMSRLRGRLVVLSEEGTVQIAGQGKYRTYALA